MRKGTKVYAIEDIDVFPGSDPKPMTVPIVKGMAGRTMAPKTDDGYYLVQFEGILGSWFILPSLISVRKPKK